MKWYEAKRLYIIVKIIPEYSLQFISLVASLNKTAKTTDVLPFAPSHTLTLTLFFSPLWSHF